MGEISSVVSAEDKKAALKRVLESEQFVGGTPADRRRREMLTLLYERSASDPPTIDSDELAKSLNCSKDTVRNDISDIRHIFLRDYYDMHRDDPVKMEIPERRRGYRVIFKWRPVKALARRTAAPGIQSQPA